MRKGDPNSKVSPEELRKLAALKQFIGKICRHNEIVSRIYNEDPTLEV